jgi:hypothetical protein
MISFAAANHYIVSKVHPTLIINADATQLNVGGNIMNKPKVKYLYRKRTISGQHLKVLKKSKEGLTAMFIKYYLIISAGSFVASPIFIIADENMKDGEIDPYEIPGLGVGNSADSKGYIIFCKKRTLCKCFYDWMNCEVFVLFVKEITKSQKLPDNSVSYFTLDGEGTQMATFKTVETQTLFQTNNFVVCKPPGSTTEVTQSADARAIFKSIKARLLKVTRKFLKHN